MLEETKSKVEELIENVSDQIDNHIELATLKASEKLVQGISIVISNLIIGILLVLSFLFLSIALAWYLSSLLEKPHIGFLIVGGFYLLLGLFFWVGKDKVLKQPLLNSIIKQLFKERNEDEN